MSKSTQTAGVQLWGGVECTDNRVEDRYFHQLQKSGHVARIADLQHLAELGLRKIRYPLLWETTAPQGVTSADWSWTDERFGRLKDLHIEPIAGLIHHGSGPLHTNLLDPSFAPGLAAFARACAERYPWIADYTPVNEPLTTARFSALYGLWYPHHRSDASFVRALVNQSRATVLAMRAIREVTPHARLVQTEDVGTVASARRLSYQATFENERRWLSLDLLCGRVDRHHPLYAFMCKGATEKELAFFCENPCPPDVIGVNYYVTSDRLLDHNLAAYPASMHGGNGRDAYVDVEAVRTPAGLRGHANALRSTWQRYHLPLAITEVHLDCHREDQLRWLDEAWRAAVQVKCEGIEVHAITVWSLLGAYDWNSLCTKDEGHYESGAFDTRSGQLRPTAVARAIRSLASTGRFWHPAMPGQGWWRRANAQPLANAGNQGRSLCFESAPKKPLHLLYDEPGATELILVVADGGPVACGLLRACEDRHLHHFVCTPDELQRIGTQMHVRMANGIKPWAVVHAARGHMGASAVFAAAHKLPFVTFLADLQTSGNANGSIDEAQPFVGADAMTRATLHDESVAKDVHSRALFLRAGPLFGTPCDDCVFAQALSLWRQGGTVVAPDDVFVSPVYIYDLVNVGLDLLIDGEEGTWHAAQHAPQTWLRLMRMWAAVQGMNEGVVRAPLASETCSLVQFGFASALTTTRGYVLPGLPGTLARYAREVPQPLAHVSHRKARTS